MTKNLNYKIEYRRVKNTFLNRLRLSLLKWLMYPIADIKPRTRASRIISHKSTGKIVKSKKPEYNPLISKKEGGKVVRIMPRQLKKIKEAQDGVQVRK